MLMLSFSVNGDLRSWRNSAPVTHWLQEFFEESNIPSHELGWGVSRIKVNTVGFRRLLGSKGTSIWRSGYLLFKLSPQAANTKMLPLTASLELSIVVSTNPGKLHSHSYFICACKGSNFSSKSSYCQLHFVLLGMYLLKHITCWQTVLLWASLYTSLHEHCQKEIFRLENCGLKSSLNLFISEVPNLIFKAEEQSAPPFQFRKEDEVTNTQWVSLPFTSKPTRNKDPSPVCY